MNNNGNVGSGIHNHCIDAIVSSLLADYVDDRVINGVELFDQPDKETVVAITDKLLKVVFPGFFRDKHYRFYNLNNRLAVLIEDVIFNLNKQIAVALRQHPEYRDVDEAVREEEAQAISGEFFSRIPKIREYVETDVQAFYEGDPAAYNKNEIILSYPGMLAITINRLAHELYLLQVPLIPRIMTEYAHSKTGIDIHPGATIGKYFFIDHGTGIVVGETTIIGDNVKIYQGVTLGALSTRGGQNLRGKRRHPTIEDNVTIYSGASILGGETVIGHDSVIGGNAFITKSIDPGTRVSIKNQELNYGQGDTKDLEASDLGLDDSWFYVI
jgi:serine O-acetyltransferase